MNSFALLVVCTCAYALTCSAQQYTNRYDNINLDEILSNRRLLQPYVRCMMDQGRCTAEGRELKSHIADALQTGCSKCTDAQKSGSRLVINHLILNEPDSWQKLVDKYDPQRTYVDVYESDLGATE